MTAIHDLIVSLADSDAEGVSVALSLVLKATDSGFTPEAWGDRGPPAWHPLNPSHPDHDFRLDYGPHYRSHSDLADVKFETPPHRRPDAEAAAAAVRADPAHVHPSRTASMENVPRHSPIHPDHPNHDFYLANPAWWHLHQGDENPMAHSGDIPTDSLTYRLASIPDHPLHPDHPDREHFLEGHSKIPIGPGSRPADLRFRTVAKPYG